MCLVLASEDQVNLVDAADARRVAVRYLCYIGLCTAVRRQRAQI